MCPDYTRRIKPNKSIVYKHLGNEVIIVNLETDKIYKLNSTAARFWELLVEKDCITEIRGIMHKEFSVDERQLGIEIEYIMNILLNGKLVSYYG